MKKISIIVFVMLISSIRGYAMDLDGQLNISGTNRTYHLHVPDGYSGELTPLVLAFHGLTLNGTQMAGITGFNDIADDENFIVVYPNGLNEQWSSPNNVNSTDMDFINTLIDELSSTYNIDSERIFATGASNGGMFTHRLALELNDRIAAVAVVAGYLPGYATMPSLSRPIAIQLFHGTDDPVIPYGEAEQALDLWMSNDNCINSDALTHLANVDPSDGTTVDEHQYTGCNDGTVVQLYEINGGEHTWPGTTSNLMGGTVSYDIDASQMIWEFFNQHPRDGGSDGETNLSSNTSATNADSSSSAADNLTGGCTVTKDQGSANFRWLLFICLMLFVAYKRKPIQN